MSELDHLQLRRIYIMAAIVFISSLLICMAQGSDYIVDVDCQRSEIITSPIYPGRYPSKAHNMWSISAHRDRRILVTFNEFMLNEKQTSDTLLIKDMMYQQDRKTYKNNNINPTPFLSVANLAQISFDSVPADYSEGFNLSVSCYDQEEGTLFVRLVNGDTPEEGFLQISSASYPTEWRKVCGTDFQINTAETVCRELGYPGVQKISYSEEGCLKGDECIHAPVCSNYTYRLTDCNVTSSKECLASSSLRIECQKPGYTGCFNFESNGLTDNFSLISIAECISYCMMVAYTSVALVDDFNCVCSNITVDSFGLHSNDSRCMDPTDENNQPGTGVLSWMAVYNTSDGFCQTLNEVANGEWNSHVTWFGSTVRLQCQEGYAVNGSDSLQCVPGTSTYYPVWNESTPSCVKIPSTTIISTSTGSVNSTTLIINQMTSKERENDVFTRCYLKHNLL